MSYNDIRYVNVGGDQIPVGHPNIVELNGGPEYNNCVEFFMYMDGSKVDMGGKGVISIDVVNTVGDTARIVFPTSGNMPYGDVYTCVSSSEKLYPKEIYRNGDNEHGCRILINFDTTVNVYFHVHADAPEGLILSIEPTDDWYDYYDDEYDTSSDSVKILSRNPTVLPKLKSGVDYGTTTERDSLPMYEGRIFYVAVD